MGNLFLIVKALIYTKKIQVILLSEKKNEGNPLHNFINEIYVIDGIK